MSDKSESKNKDGDNAAADNLLPKNPLTWENSGLKPVERKGPNELLKPFSDPVLENLTWEGRVRAAKRKSRKSWVTDIK